MCFDQTRNNVIWSTIQRASTRLFLDNSAFFWSLLLIKWVTLYFRFCIFLQALTRLFLDNLCTFGPCCWQNGQFFTSDSVHVYFDWNDVVWTEFVIVSKAHKCSGGGSDCSAFNLHFECCSSKWKLWSKIYAGIWNNVYKNLISKYASFLAIVLSLLI